MEGKKRFINYKCSNTLYHVNFSGKITTKTSINVSTYIPVIIKKLLQSIPKDYNNHYVICPYYTSHYDYQIGITETIKENETFSDAIQRGVNEECGLHNITWFNKIELNYNRNWFGVLSREYSFNPNIIENLNKDTQDKVAIIIYDNVYNILRNYENIQIGDIRSDGIQGLGLLSVYDCKKLIQLL